LSDAPGDEATATIAPVAGVDSDEDEIALAAGDLAAGDAVLVVRRGPNVGERFPLDRDVTRAGRHPDSDIFLDDITVSRRHAEVHRLDGRYTVRDTGSLNGTYLNRERIDDAPLVSGDEVQIGKYRLVFLSAQ
jgi:pSer/pThr/pTyr-binding forkhead associated (FHA) protein